MIQLTEANFGDEVLQEKTKPVLVDFWGENCERCHALMPDYQELEHKYGNSIKFCELNTTTSRKLAIKERVLGLPTVVLYIEGEKKEILTPNKIESVSSIELLLRQYCS